MMTQEKQKKKNWFLKNAEKMNTKCKGKTEKKISRQKLHLESKNEVSETPNKNPNQEIKAKF